jgi:hypothetical protein
MAAQMGVLVSQDRHALLVFGSGSFFAMTCVEVEPQPFSNILPRTGTKAHPGFRTAVTCVNELDSALSIDSERTISRFRANTVITGISN